MVTGVTAVLNAQYSVLERFLRGRPAPSFARTSVEDTSLVVPSELVFRIRPIVSDIIFSHISENSGQWDDPRTLMSATARTQGSSQTCWVAVLNFQTRPKMKA